MTLACMKTICCSFSNQQILFYYGCTILFSHQHSKLKRYRMSFCVIGNCGGSSTFFYDAVLFLCLPVSLRCIPDIRTKTCAMVYTVASFYIHSYTYVSIFTVKVVVDMQLKLYKMNQIQIARFSNLFCVLVILKSELC